VIRALVLTIATLAAGRMPTTSAAGHSSIPALREVDDTAIAAVRHIYAAVQAHVRSGALRRVDTTFQCDSKSLEYEAHWYVDSAGTIRRLDLGLGTGDHAEQWSFYYDTTQQLRFAFAQRGAVIGSQQEERVYYDVHGTRIARRIRWIHGPHYQFSLLAPVWNPKAWRNAACT
jgi:hypothetical protein